MIVCRANRETVLEKDIETGDQLYDAVVEVCAAGNRQVEPLLLLQIWQQAGRQAKSKQHEEQEEQEQQDQDQEQNHEQQQQ